MEFNSNAGAPSDSPADPMAGLSAAQLAQMASEQLSIADSYFAGFEALTTAGPSSAPPPSTVVGAVPPPSVPVGDVPPPTGTVGSVPPPSAVAGAVPPPTGPVGSVPPPSGPVGAVQPPAAGMGTGAEAATPVARRPQTSEKKSRGRPKGSVNRPKPRPMDLPSNDAPAVTVAVPAAVPVAVPAAVPAGIDFRAHTLVVAPGEDVAMRLSLFAEEMSPRTIFVISVIGSVSSSVLSQPGVPSCGILRNDTIYPLQHISGTCVHTKIGGVYERNGVFSACLANAAGQTVGGQIAGPLIAAHPVMIVVGSFIFQDVDGEAKTPVDESAPGGPSGGGNGASGGPSGGGDGASGAPQAVPTI